MFGPCTDKQSAAITLFSVCWTKVRNINIWKDHDLDYILHKGDMIFKETGISHALHVNELPQQVNVENIVFDVTIVSQVDGHIENISDSDDSSEVNIFLDENLFFSEKVTGAIIFFNGPCVSILKERVKVR
uniref:Uncharacterized protein n=1 Tax=Clytia hemisphaerica TaxID=252671 RepID=A0A7M5WMZ5_9CNID